MDTQTKRNPSPSHCPPTPQLGSHHISVSSYTVIMTSNFKNSSPLDLYTDLISRIRNFYRESIWFPTI